MDPADVVPVALTTRSGVVESIHHGIVLAVDRDGRVARQAGNPAAAVYPRSALKPLQAHAMLASGLVLDDEALAVACASHSGEPGHTAVVERILASAGLDPGALRNTADFPVSRPAAAAVIRAGGGPAPLFQNCSGKHAAMLATCVVNGWSIEDYLDEHHPLQQAITATIVRLAGGVAHNGIDGCGAPTAVVSLSGMVAAVRTIATSGDATYRAMVTHPALVAGDERSDTIVMRAVPGLMAKAGAEGIGVAAHPDGRAVGVKIADGADRARVAVLLDALAALGFDVADVAPAVLAVLGHGRPVGEVSSVLAGT
jgi:L-asparaginase II